MSRKWHIGDPPHVGWWNASTERSDQYWRWWDGKNWSMAAPDCFDEISAACRAAQKVEDFTGMIEWADYYPKNARVPRIDPRKVES